MVSPSPSPAGRSYIVFRSAGSSAPVAPFGVATGVPGDARCDHQPPASSSPAAPATSSSRPARSTSSPGARNSPFQSAKRAMLVPSAASTSAARPRTVTVVRVGDASASRPKPRSVASARA